jgi:hypothetical protein
LTEQHLRPGAVTRIPEIDLQSPGTDALSLPWERRSELGWSRAAWGTTRLLLFDPLAAFGRTRLHGGFRGPLLFALIITAVASTLGELVDGIARLSLGLEGSGNISDILDLRVNEEPVPGAAWFPGAALGVVGLGGCALGLLIGVPVFALLFPLVILVWTGTLHLCLKLVGGLRLSGSGYQGTWASICYATAAFVPGMVPLIGDWLAFLWLGVLQGIGFRSLHRASPVRAAAALLLPFAVVGGLWLLKTFGLLPIELGNGP